MFCALLAIGNGGCLSPVGFFSCGCLHGSFVFVLLVYWEFDGSICCEGWLWFLFFERVCWFGWSLSGEWFRPLMSECVLDDPGTFLFFVLIFVSLVVVFSVLFRICFFVVFFFRFSVAVGSGFVAVVCGEKRMFLFVYAILLTIYMLCL